MRLSISNLALPSQATIDDLVRFAEIGLRGVEVAPTRIAPWAALDATTLVRYRESLVEAGLTVSSMQAIFFGIDGVALLKDLESFKRLERHFHSVVAVGARLGASVLVFGAPKQRSSCGLPEADAFDLGAERLHILAEIAGAEGLVIGMEPVPEAYNGDFLCTWQDVDRMVQVVGHPNLMVHLDTGCIFLGGGNVEEAVKATADRLCHFHIAEPKLASFAEPIANHARAACALKSVNYSRWIAIEMLEVPTNPIQAVEKAVSFAAASYPIIDAY